MSKRTFALCFAVLFCASAASYGQGTKLWNQSRYDEWEKGQPQGVALASDGHMEPGPVVKQLALTDSAYVWAVAADAHGNVYAGTGSPATVVRVSPDGKTNVLLKSKDLTVQAVRVGPDGAVYAATVPGGKVYRLDPEQKDVEAEKAAVAFDPKSVETAGGSKSEDAPKYIWDLAFDTQGRLYVATGAPAAIYRVATPGQSGPAANAKPELWFKSDEQHIRSLLVERDGTIIAGSDGDGLVYRIDHDGKGVIAFNAPKREITALAEAPDGRLYVAAVGEKGKSGLPPLPVQGISSVTATITIVAPGSVQASNNNALVPDGSELYELSREGAPRRLWAAHEDVVYALHWTPGGLIAATGNRGRVYRVTEDGQYADVAHAEASQVTSFASGANGELMLGTSNTGKLYTMSAQPASESTYLSESFDAGVFARWGRAEVDAAHASGGTPGYELYVRSGNVSNPERNWSAWRKVAPSAATVGTPAARFLQWKAVLRPGARMNAVGINYLPVNVAPVVDEVVVQPGARVNQQAQIQPSQQSTTVNLPSASANVINIVQDQSTGPLPAIKDKNAVTARWAAHDDNGDEMIFAVYYRGADELNWQLLKDKVTERFLSFDAQQLPDGAYRLKVVASDAPSQPPGEALTGERESDRFLLDTTSPAMGPLTARMESGKIHVTGDAKDAASAITHAEYSVDAGPWQFVEPVGRLSDAQAEHYDFLAPLRPANPSDAADRLPPGDPAEHVVTLRVYDRFENAASAKAVVR